MKKYVHIGYAKSGSTWLQWNLFPRHRQLFHLGRAYGDSIIDDDVRLVLWSDLIEKPEFLFDEVAATRCFERYFEQAEKMSGIRACGISHELITNTCHGRVDLSERARRVARIFGPGTEIIMVVRNQLSFIRSLYTGLVKEGGITRTYDEYLFYFYYDQDRSPFSILFYDKVYELYANLFGAEHVHVVPFEILQTRSPLRFAREVCEGLGVDPIQRVDASQKNQSPSPKMLSLMLEVNKQFRFYLGNDAFERPWGYCARPLYTKVFGIEEPKENRESARKYLNVFQMTDASVEEVERQGVILPEMNTQMSDHYRDLFCRAYAPANARLQELTGLDLREFGYPLENGVPEALEPMTITVGI
ncbi:MAG TPA: hypothetical protein VMY42_01610 [Thermoguttaceae bacterium]|nr:hypothetical protein [Thermoguttaceae bacterium]